MLVMDSEVICQKNPDSLHQCGLRDASASKNRRFLTRSRPLPGLKTGHASANEVPKVTIGIRHTVIKRFGVEI